MDVEIRPWVLHVDLDQFIAAVEVLRRPELAGVPLIVGGRGDPSERAVVSTASFEARAFGVGSGMPLRLAARKAPDAVILPVDAPAYEAASTEVMSVLRSLDGGIVEIIGWGEAFVGVQTADPQACGLEGFGAAGQARHHHGAGAGRRRPRCPDRRVRPRMGAWYADLGHGRGSAVVDDSPWIARGHSREHTYQQGITEPGDVDDAIAQLVREVLEDVGREGRPAIRLTLKIRYKPFFTKTFSRTLPQPTTDAVVVLAEARALTAKREAGRPIRLLGLRVEMAMPEADPVERTPIHRVRGQQLGLLGRDIHPNLPHRLHRGRVHLITRHRPGRAHDDGIAPQSGEESRGRATPVGKWAGSGLALPIPFPPRPTVLLYLPCVWWADAGA